MRVAPDALLRALADGEPHSGSELARGLGVTRAAISKSMRKLALWGLDVSAVPGVGYRLARPIDLLDARALRRALAPRTARRLARLEVLTEVDSTNRRLLESAPPPPGKLAACLAEFQTAGRGRRGRRWLAPLGGGLCLSAGWQFAGTPRDLSALTLAVGVVARRALADAARVDVALKWPNDLVHDERKLGGILLELAAEAQGRCYVVAGIGINVALPPKSLRVLSDWPRGAIDLAIAMRGAPPPRALLAGAAARRPRRFVRVVRGDGVRAVSLRMARRGLSSRPAREARRSGARPRTAPRAESTPTARCSSRPRTARAGA